MNRYIIVPKANWKSEPIMADDKIDALISFAASMDTDMTQYFEAVREDELSSFIANRQFASYKTHVINFMSQVAACDFDITGEAIDDVAEEAFDIYSKGRSNKNFLDGHTEYEAVEEAVSRYKERNK